MSSRWLWLCCCALCWGCVATTVHSGRPPLEVAEGYEERWHSAFFWGLLTAHPPYDLAKICPHGWSQVTVGRDPFTLLSGMLTLFVYSPTRVTVVCAIDAGRALPPASGYAPNAPFMPGLPGGS